MSGSDTMHSTTCIKFYENITKLLSIDSAGRRQLISLFSGGIEPIEPNLKRLHCTDFTDGDSFNV